ncbi:MAG: hypothetical protein KDD64_00460, partial [Bdellovibrionales bacterium]|nr:hypothetical protein [Bdellovibrionales bacterium]
MPSQHRDNRQRIVLDSEGLSLHSDDMPKLVELPKHTAQLLLQRGQLEKNEIVGLIDLVKDDEDALRAAYTLAVNSIDLGFTFSSIVKPGFLKKEEQLAFQRCIKAWAGITQSELFENVWVTFEERPSAYLQDLHLPSKILILLREMQKVSPTTTLVSSATPEQFLGESAIRVNELPKIELILKHSKFPAADISFLCDSETHRPTRKELQAYYDGGHRALSHRFLFRERQVVDIQPSAEERRLQAIEPLIREFADLEDDIDVEKFLPSRDRFAFLSQGAKKAFTPEEDFILQAIEVLSKHVESLNEEPRNALLNDLCDVSPELRGAAFELLENLCIASVPLANYSGIVATLASHRGDLPNGCLEVLTATSRLKPQLFVEATAVVEDLLQHETDLTEFVPLFEQGEIAPLIREVYIKRLREHQQRFPEKALEEVRIAFESPEVGGITEPAKVEALEMAFSLYERIQAEGEVLIGTPRPTLREEIQKLVSKIGAKQKPEVEEQVSEKDAVDQEVNLDGDLVRYLALSRELFRAHFGVYPYNTQVIAAILLIRADSFEQSSKSGVYAQVKTGEGKSLLTTLLAGYYAAQGRKVDIVTSNTYLAERDAKKFADYFADQGFSCISHEHGEGVETVSSDPSIIYSTNHDMIFTYLRSRL